MERAVITKIKETYHQNKKRIATVIEGPGLGQKVMVSGGGILLHTPTYDAFNGAENDIEQVTQSGAVILGDNRVFVEVISGSKKLVICGGGHVSIPIIEIGRRIGFHVTVLEDRPYFADDARRAGADVVICDGFKAALDRVEGDEETYFVIVTRGHRYDGVCLEEIVQKKHRYIGMMGSKVRVRKVKEELMAKGIEKERLDTVHTPIGLAIKAETPEEIAISILAELISVKNQVKTCEGYTQPLMAAVLEDTTAHYKAMATIVSRKGSAPRSIGTKMMIYPDGRIIGTIGGGCAEAEVIRKGMQMIGEPNRGVKLHTVNMTALDAEEEGMVCGGIIEVLLETFV